LFSAALGGWVTKADVSDVITSVSHDTHALGTQIVSYISR